jgi:hypothetical protein
LAEALKQERSDNARAIESRALEIAAELDQG